MAGNSFGAATVGSAVGEGELVRIDVADVFAECTRRLGGIVLDDAPASSKKKNADFAFKNYQVVVELKCMEESFWGKEAFQRKLSSLADGWIRKGLVPLAPRGRRTFELSTLPAQCQRDFSDLLKSKLSGYFKEANRQIRATKEELGMIDASGVLILVNDGNEKLPPRIVRYLSALLLAHNFRCINTVLHVVANLDVTSIEQEVPFRIWSPWGIKRASETPQNFLEDLRREYLDVLDGRGHPAESVDGTLDMFENLELMAPHVS